MTLQINSFQWNDWFMPALLLAALAIGLLIRAIWEPTALECLSVELELPPVSEGETGPRLLLLSDLHAEFFRVKPDHLLQACCEARPDIILFAGDLSAKARGIAVGLDLISQIRRLPELANCPFLAVRGNHDSDETVALLRQAGVIVLENQGEIVHLQNQQWMVIGLEDLKRGHPDAAEPLRQAEAAGILPQRRIVLAHNPDTLLGLPAGAAGLFLAGHFHGGQIWMPFHFEFVVLRREKLLRLGIYKGSFVWEGMPAYISRGLGCVVLPLRLLSRPELTLFAINSQKSELVDSIPVR